eukprot:1736664-Ditylum_brightwellii.AAC.1
MLNDVSRDGLITHAMTSLIGCVSGDVELTKENGSIAVVWKDEKFTLIEGDGLQPYLDWLDLDGGMGGSDYDDALIAKTCMQTIHDQILSSSFYLHAYIYTHAISIEHT